MQYRIANIAPSGSTEIQGAILAACMDIKEDSKSKNNQIILITDGESRIDAKEVLSGLEDANAQLITIYINSNINAGAVAKLAEISDDLFVATVSWNGTSLKLVNVKDKGREN